MKIMADCITGVAVHNGKEKKLLQVTIKMRYAKFNRIKV